MTETQTPLERLRRLGMGARKAAARYTDLTDQERTDAIAALIEWQLAEDLSNEAAAGVLQCSPTTISQIRNRRNGYDGPRADKYLQRFLRILADREIRMSRPEQPFVLTSIAGRILTCCQLAWECETLAMVVTPSGWGKSAALQEWVRRRGDRGVYVSAGQASKGQRALLGQLSLAFGVRTGAKQTSGDHYHRVRDRLAQLRAGGRADSAVIVIDEAQACLPRTLDMLRNLHDDMAARPSIVLAGSWHLDTELRRTDRLAGGYEQIRSRCQHQMTIPAGAEMAEDDVRLIVKACLYAMGVQRPKLSAAAMRLLVELAGQPGALRNVVTRLRTVRHYAGLVGVEPTWSAQQIDYVAPLNGGACQMPDSADAFDRAAGPVKDDKDSAARRSA